MKQAKVDVFRPKKPLNNAKTVSYYDNLSSVDSINNEKMRKLKVSL
jgi:hypothetical protein